MLITAILCNALTPTTTLAKSNRAGNPIEATRKPLAMNNPLDGFFLIRALGNLRLFLQGHNTFIVDSFGDMGDNQPGDGLCNEGTDRCTLRAALEEANAEPGKDTIAFNLAEEGPYLIQPETPLPVITDPVVIDGTTQPGYNGMPLIVIDGALAGENANGLDISAGLSTVRGLAIYQFGNSGIYLKERGGNSIEGNYIGTDVSGTLAMGNRIGVLIENIPGNAIGNGNPDGRNLVSGNQIGIYLYGDKTRGNRILANFIGTDISGTESLGNDIGIRIQGASGNTVGESNGQANNVIRGNAANVLLQGAGRSGNTLQTDAQEIDLGKPATIILEGRPNRNGTGIDNLELVSKLEMFNQDLPQETGTPPGTSTRVGQSTVVPLNYHLASYNPRPLLGLTFVVNSTGDGSDKKTSDGVCSTAQGVCTLRAAIQQANVSVGADIINFSLPGSAPYIIQPGSALPIITGVVTINGTTQPGYAGTPIIQLNGASAGAGVNGLQISAGSSTVRGLNVRNFNSAAIYLTTNGGNTIAGNYIGTDVTGNTDNGNHWIGIYVNGISNNVIGGTTTTDRNLIAGNDSYGVEVYGTGATNNLIQGNYIGTNAAGTTALGNQSAGVYLYYAAGNTVGGTTPGAGNLISGNNGSGILIYGAGATGNLIQGNYIGINVTGSAALGNTQRGVLLNGVSGTGSNTVGGTTVAARNVISGNQEIGIYLYNNTSTTLIQGNYVGTDVAGSVDLGNGIDGIGSSDSPNNTIGGTVPGAGNLISVMTATAFICMAQVPAAILCKAT